MSKVRILEIGPSLDYDKIYGPKEYWFLQLNDEVWNHYNETWKDKEFREVSSDILKIKIYSNYQTPSEISYIVSKNEFVFWSQFFLGENPLSCNKKCLDDHNIRLSSSMIESNRDKVTIFYEEETQLKHLVFEKSVYTFWRKYFQTEDKIVFDDLKCSVCAKRNEFCFF